MIPISPWVIWHNREKTRPFFPKNLPKLRATRTGSIVLSLLAMALGSRKMKPMRLKIRPSGKNFVKVVFKRHGSATRTACSGTPTKLRGKKAGENGPVPLRYEKYQILTGINPAFFLQPKRYKGTKLRKIIEMCQVSCGNRLNTLYLLRN
jgi:hypothetical protein